MICKICGRSKKKHSKDQREECKYVRDYVKQTQVGPFPVQFITVDPVVFFGNNVLLVRRKGHPGRGKLALPGGFVNPNERLIDGCLRECLEETGLRLRKEWLVVKDVFDDPKRAPGVRIVTHAFGFDIPVGESFNVSGADDASWAGFMSIAELKKEELHEDHFEIISALINQTGDKKL